jgi:hypothetical protein
LVWSIPASTPFHIKPQWIVNETVTSAVTSRFPGSTGVDVPFASATALS